MTHPSRTVPALVRPPGAPGEESLGPRIEAELAPEPPKARCVPRALTIHGDTRVDEYFWLRNREDPEVLAYLEAENRYTEAVMQPHRGAAGARSSPRCAGGSRRPTFRCPSGIDGWLYYHRTEDGRPVSHLLPAAGG